MNLWAGNVVEGDVKTKNVKKWGPGMWAICMDS
jgi:hypothetical protein